MRKERRKVGELRASKNRALAAAAYQANPGLSPSTDKPKGSNNKNIFDVLSKSMSKGGATKRVGGGHAAVPPPKRDGREASPRAQRLGSVSGAKAASPRRHG